mmetsp:Transcript_35285/g.85094  ORF Transcript_35285/g.85094 Transcript_35285/m.85094 type:complete len:506 (+) Transcript_35285:116-1633(+)
MVKLRFSFLRKGESSKRRINAAAAAAHEPTATTRPRAKGADGGANKRPVGGTAANNNGNTSSGGLFGKKNRGPGGIEVTTTTPHRSSASAGRHNPQDEVSVMTPVTGIPPDSPDRLRRLPPSLLPPPLPGRTGMDVAKLYPGTFDDDCSPPSTPTKGGGMMNIDVSRDYSGGDDDDVSVMTPVTGMPSPDKKYSGRMAPPQILEDDEGSRELTVYEDNEEADGSGGGSGFGGGGHGMIRLSPKRSSRQRKIEPSFDAYPTKGVTKGAAEANSTAAATKKLMRGKRSWLTGTEYFKRAVESAFDTVDADKSGDVTMEELYAGLLLIHLKMAVYVGAPACRPASKEYVKEIFHLLDVDGDGTLSKEEFATVMKILYSQVFTRIVIQWGLTLMIVPVISQYIINYAKLVYWIAHEFWKDIDDDLDPLQRLLWKLWSLFLYLVPFRLEEITTGVRAALFDKVPSGVWKSAPFTILTLAQTSVALPYALNRVEDFFWRAAVSRTGLRQQQ